MLLSTPEMMRTRVMNENMKIELKRIEIMNYYLQANISK